MPPPTVRRSSSVVERTLGKGEVGSSILPCGTISLLTAEIAPRHMKGKVGLWVPLALIWLHLRRSKEHHSKHCVARCVTSLLQALQRLDETKGVCRKFGSRTGLGKHSPDATRPRIGCGSVVPETIDTMDPGPVIN